jgi:hypothetical protein
VGNGEVIDEVRRPWVRGEAGRGRGEEGVRIKQQRLAA